MTFNVPSDYDGPLPEQLLALREQIEPHGFYLATGRRTKTVYVKIRDRKLGYYNATVSRGASSDTARDLSGRERPKTAQRSSAQ